MPHGRRPLRWRIATENLRDAAPDLAAACRAALALFEVNDDEDANRVAAQIRAALAKAEGQS